MMKKVMIMAGEASGDLHGANLARELLKQDASLVLYGVGSRRMRECGVTLLADASDISVVGFTEALSRAFVIWRVFSTLKRFLVRERPDLLILIDFPDFNIMLGKAARKLGIPVLYYISPQVWVWRKGRIKTIARLVRAIIVVFPFEVPLYQKQGVDVRFLGHPLTDVVQSCLTQGEARGMFGLDASRRTIALLPGSRRTEIEHLLPDMLKAAEILSRQFPDLQFVLPVAPTLDFEQIKKQVETGPVPVIVVREKVYDALRGADAAIVASGTATLETGLMELPMVIVYRISPLTYYLLTMLVTDVKYIGLVNIVLGKGLVPELIQHESTPENMADAIARLLTDHDYYAGVKDGLRSLRHCLGDSGASVRAAAVVRELLAGAA